VGYVQPLQIALGQMAMGEPLLAIDCLSKGAQGCDPHMLWLHLWPLLDPLRDEAEFKSLLRHLGLPKPVPADAV
jgi:hypothetical protein